MGRLKIITDEEMLKGARECFLKFGPSVSTAQIARYIGVSQATIFKRYKTKNHLVFSALTGPEDSEWFLKIENGPDDSDIRKQLSEIMTSLSTKMEKMTPQMSMLRASGLDPHKMFTHKGHPPPVRLIKALSGWFSRAQKKGLIRKVNPLSLSFMIVGAMHSRPFIQHLAADESVKIGSRAHVNAVVNTLLDGILPGDCS